MGTCSSTDSNINEKTNLMTTHDIISVRDSWRSVVHQGLIDYGTEFMTRLFIKYPNLRHLWAFTEGLDSVEKLRDNTSLIIHGEKLFTAIETIIYTLDDMDSCTKLIIKLGYTHYKRGVREEHFQVFGELLLEILQNGIGKAFDSKVKASWTKFFLYIETEMKIGFDNCQREYSKN